MIGFEEFRIRKIELGEKKGEKIEEKKGEEEENEQSLEEIGKEKEEIEG